MEVKQVNSLQRIISGYAAVIGNVDLGGDVIDPGAFTKTLARKKPAEIGVFVGHDMSSLPVGIPITLRVDGKGLYSETLVKPGPVGDDLLLTAKFMADHGRPLGQSIGYRVAPGGAAMDRIDGKVVRRLKEVDLHEYSFAAGMAVMNPEALTTGVKTTDGSKATWTSAQINDLPDSSFLYIEPGGSKDGDGRTTPRSLRHFPYKDASGSVDLPHLRNALARIPQSSLSAALKERLAARARSILADAGGGKTLGGPMNDDPQTYPNLLPDSAYLYVQSGGVLDDEGKTVPRTLRHFRFRGADGAIDPAALTAALAEIPQAKTAGLDEADLARLTTRVRRMSEQFGRGEKVTDEPSEWKSGAVLDLLTIAYRLIDLSQQVVVEHKAMAVIGENTKNGWRLRPDVQTELKAASDELARIVGHAALVAEGKDEEALADWWRAQFSLLEVGS